MSNSSRGNEIKGADRSCPYCKFLYCGTVEDLGFTTLVTSQIISIAFYREREMSEKFSSDALISALGSFTCRKFTTQDPLLYFPSEGSHTQDFYALKKSIDTSQV